MAVENQVEAKAPAVTKKVRVKGSITKQALAKLRKEEPKDLGELVEAMRADYQVKLGELVILSNARAAKFSVGCDSPATAGDFQMKRAKLLADHLLSMFERKLPVMLECCAFGRVAFEKVFAFEELSQLNFLHDLADMPFGQTEMVLHPDGSYAGFKLDSLSIPAEKSWWLALNPTAVEPHGKSMYLGAPHKTWERRQDVLNLRDLFVQRFALRGGVAHAPPTAEDENGNPIDVFDEIEKAYAEVQSGGLMMLPDERDKDGRYVYDFTEAKLESFAATPILEVLNAMDAEQLLSIGIPPKTVMEGDAVGSFALVSQQMLLLYAVVEGVLDQVVESFNKYVAEKLTEMNFNPDVAPVIAILYQKLTERPNDLAMEIVKSWLTTPQLSPLILSGAVDLAAVFKSVGIAVTEEFDQKVEALKTLMVKPPSTPMANMSLGLGFGFPFH